MLITSGFQEGDVVLLRARWWVRRLMGARYDHAALLWVRFGSWFTVEAGATGVRAYRVGSGDDVWGHWDRAFDVFRPAVPAQVCDHLAPRAAALTAGHLAANAALGRLGERYAFENLAAIVRKMLKRRVGLQAVVCTELVQQAWAAAGVELCAGNEHPTPDELWRELSMEPAVAGREWPPAYYVQPPPTEGKRINGV